MALEKRPARVPDSAFRTGGEGEIRAVTVLREGLDAPGARPVRKEHDAPQEVRSPHLEGNLLAGAVDLVALEGEGAAVGVEEPDRDRFAYEPL